MAKDLNSNKEAEKHPVYWLYWNMVNNERHRLERSWAALVGGLFQDLYNRIKPHVMEATYSNLLRIEIEATRSTWKMRFEEQWNTLWPALAMNEYANLAAMVDEETPERAPWDDYQKMIVAGLFQRVDKILDTTRKRWDPDITPTFDDEVLTMIRDDLNVREKIIIQVEALVMTALAQQWGIEKLGADKFEKTWLTMEDDYVRNTHEEQHGLTLPIDSVFPNGLRYPGDTDGDPSEWIGCRCVQHVKPRSKNEATGADL